MKKFLTKTFIYGFILISFCFAAQYIIDSGLSGYNDDLFADWNNIFKGRLNTDVIILGSSRAFVHFNPRIIDEITGLSSYNLAVDGGTAISQKTKLDAFLDFNPPPKIIIQNVDIFLLYKEKYVYQKEQFLPYLNKTSIHSNLQKIDNAIWLERIIPLIKYRGFRYHVVLGFAAFFDLAQKPQTFKYKGYQGIELDWNNDFENFKAKNKILRYSDESLTFGYDHVEQLIDECKEKKIDIVLVQSPLYFELQNIMPQKDSITNKFSEIAQKKGINFWDYFDDSLCFDQKYFYNSTHLNLQGSEIFSNRFAQKLKNYLSSDLKDAAISGM